MDIQRPLILVALAIVGYLMLLQWNDDYHKVPEETEQVATVQQQKNENTLDQGIHQPAPDIGQNTNDNHVATVNQPTTTQVNDEKLISVETDVLKVKINPKGGNIVQLDLIQYPKTLNSKVPFRLFSDSGNVIYSADTRVFSTTETNDIPLYKSVQTNYQLANNENELKVNLTYSNNGISYLKTYTFMRGMDKACADKKKDRVSCVNPKSYEVKVDYQIINNSDKEWKGYFLASLTRNNAADPSSTTATSMTTFLGMAYWTPDKPYTRVSTKNVDSIMNEANQKKAEENLNYLPIPSATVQGGWIAWLQHYFVTAWIGEKGQNHIVKTYKNQQGNYIISFTTPLMTAKVGGEVKEDFTLYAGPKLQDSLKELSPGLDLTIDYGILSVIGKPIFWLLQIIHSFVGNWGWSIIILTIIIKLIFFPLSATSYKSMARMRAASPKMQAIKERYGDDRAKISEAMMKLYKEEKLNPLSGCLPIIIQMPVFIALYWVLLESVEIRQAPWLGWIHDLSVSDPYLILPIIMGTTMFLQQRLNPTPPDPIQAKVFKIMPIMFTFFFIWFPAGLVLYWIVNNILSILQQWIITRQIEAGKKK